MGLNLVRQRHFDQKRAVRKFRHQETGEAILGRGENRTKAQKLAEHLKKTSPIRTHGTCPFGCGAMIKNGGPQLLAHLMTCRGSRKRDRRRNARVSTETWQDAA